MRDIVRALDKLERDLKREILCLKSIQDQVTRIKSELGLRTSRQTRDPKKGTTKFDKLIDVVRRYGRNGLRIGQVQEFMISEGEDISYNAVSSYLTRAKKIGLVTKRKPFWYPVFLNETEEEGDIPRKVSSNGQ